MNHGELRGYDAVSLTQHDTSGELLLLLSIVSVFCTVCFEQGFMLILQRRVLPLPLGFEE